MKEKHENPFIIGLSVGIGNSIIEAQTALKKAKSMKEEVIEGKPIRVRFNGDYCISTYDGEPQNDKFVPLIELENDIEILNEYKEKDPQVYSHILEIIEGKKIDSSTGTFTPYGYQFELNNILEREMKERGRLPKRNILFFDCNDMHHWNDFSNYDEVTRHISKIGEALNGDTHGVETGERYSDLVARIEGYNPLVHRIHGNAGDEFAIDVRCPQNQLVPLGKRLIKSAYIAQANMYKGEQRDELESMLGISF